MQKRFTLLAAAALLAAACAPATTPAPAPTPAPDLGRRAVGARGMVSSAHPLASEAGLEILRQGGNAVDAAVATAFAIGVVEPHMSGIGGSGTMLVWQQQARRADYLDFYAAQPVAAFAGAPEATAAAAPLRGTGVPGEVAGLLEAHERFGRLSRQAVLAPAIRLAAEGYPLYQAMGEMIERDSVRLGRDPVARALFWSDGRLKVPGDLIVNPELATVLRRISADGRRGFYEGETGRALVARLNEGGHPVRLADLAGYTPVWRRPLCAVYRGRVVLSAPPPQGGARLLHSLELLEPHDLPALGYPMRSARAFDVFASALRVAQRGSAGNVDPRWMEVPARGMVSEEYAAARRDLVGSGQPADSIPGLDAGAYDAAPSPEACRPFEPYGAASEALGAAPSAGAPSDATRAPAAPAALMGPVADAAIDGGETTHLSVVDDEGNAVALTVTNSSVFGSRVGVMGFFLNDSGISSFARSSLDRAGALPWRTRPSTIAPTIVLDDDARVRMVVGAPGSGRIPQAVMQAMSYVLDYGLDPLEALRMPRIYASSSSLQAELEGSFDPLMLAEVRRMGYRPTSQAFGYARVYIIVRHGDQWVGAADPRHDGQPRGY